ncbi:hypothetical protein K6327_000922 [Vibrio vulnificus]|nr:hypothetical protein [Vibrio vulnificus]
MVQYIGVICIIICLLHYLYQAVYLPTYRHNARDELFQYRDELRARLIEVQDDADKSTLLAFQEADEALNRALNRLHLLTFTNYIKFLKREKDPQAEIESKNFREILERSTDETPMEIILNANKTLQKVFAINSLLFMFYLLPLILAIHFAKKLGNQATKAAKTMVDECMVHRNSMDRMSA